MKKLIVANWKMNVPDLKQWRGFRAPKNVDVVICPPFPFLSQISNLKSQSVSLGAQDLFWEEKGAFTGEVSGIMLKNAGVKYVIVGHSERRKWLNETDAAINKKILIALKAGLKVILCVGEPLAVRKKGMAAAKSFVKNQLTKDLYNLKPKTSNLIVAYEPVWAIGTGKADNPEESAEIARFIRLWFAVHGSKCRVLYGGSVNSKNIAGFIQYKDIGGALVGGASLNAEEFQKIIKVAA